MSPDVETAACAARPASPALSTTSSLAAQRTLLAGWLLATDALALVTAFGSAYWIRFGLQITVAPEVAARVGDYQILTACLVPLWLLVFVAFQLYDPQRTPGGIVESSRVFHACTTATMLVIVATFLFPEFVISRMWLVSVWLLSFLFVAANRFAERRVVYACRRRGYLLSPAVIVGTNDEALTLATFLGDWQESGLRTMGFVTTGDSPGSVGPADPPLGSADEIAAIVRTHAIEEVIVAITSIRREELLRLCENVDPLPVQLRVSSGLYELLTTRVTLRTLGTVPLMSLQKNRLEPVEALVKTLLDRCLAGLALLVLSPLMGLIAVWIKIDSPGPVFYRRKVLGTSRGTFDAFKFRTMHVDGDDLLKQHSEAARNLRVDHKLKNDPRVTKAGRWLRRFSLDELPQLLNVLGGQMSLVGPRMITEEEAAKYGRHRMSLLAVKPGITGLWQVSGRSDLTYDERVRIDMYYVRNYSVWLDLQILFIQTLPAVLRGRGAY